MAEGLGDGGVEEYKDVLLPSIPTTNAASPRLPLGSLVSNTITATPCKRTLTEDLRSADAKVGGCGKEGKVHPEDRRKAFI